MIRIASENELRESFRVMDRDQVILPEQLRFPLEIEDYLAWVEPSGARVYLLFDDRKRKLPLGIVFRRDQSVGGGSPRMCEWCHSIRGGDQVSLLTATANSQRRIGIQLCRDLSCKSKLLEQAPDIHDFNEGISSEARLRKTIQRMSEFATRNLF